MKFMSVEDLADFAAIQQVAMALWRRRATAFVGAGFSRNAERASPHTPWPPLWTDLQEAMTARLYGTERKLVPSDPLKLAEEFRALFGQAALDDFVRDQVPDIVWTPGAAHRRLLELPWSDVLSTNYDTLLERTSLQIDGIRYEPVRLETDLAHARAPRIVKLHGSIGASEHFILAEEDYRTYPARHAAFVNFARQSFIENELCLLGFSGDDPNFLQWSGWVRDHLGSSTRRIYLVGLLDLSAAKRKYLELRNIAPIDLAPLVDGHDPGERHARAAMLFLDYLHAARPKPAYDWEPTALPNSMSGDDFRRVRTDPAFAAEIYRRELPLWQRDRQTYPGWLICPKTLWHWVSGIHEAPMPTPANLSTLPDAERARVAFEYVWRQHTGLNRLHPVVADLAETFTHTERDCDLTKAEQMTLALVLADHARAADDGVAFERLIGRVEAFAADGSDLRAGTAYQRALTARDSRDLAAVETLLPQIQGLDPVWGLRRAALWCDLGELERAEEEVTDTLADLRQRQRLDETSLWVISRRAWAEWFARALDQNKLTGFVRWNEEYRISLCDPWVLREAVTDDLRGAVNKRKQDESIQPKFAPGRYTDPSNTVHFVGDMHKPAEAFRRLVEDAGIPFHLDYVNTLGEAVQDLATLYPPATTYEWLRLISMLRGRGSSLEQLFGRVTVAAISPDVREGIVIALRREIAFWRGRTAPTPKRRSFVVDRLALLVELLARFTACAKSDAAVEAFHFALELGVDQSVKHPWLFESVSNLAQCSLEAVAPHLRGTLITASLAFSTADEADCANVHHYPQVSSWLWWMTLGASRPKSAWNGSINRLLERMDGDRPDREAMLRLGPLAKANLLRPSEAKRFARALWRKPEGDPPLPDIQPYFPSALVWLPRPDGVDVEARLEQRLFKTPDKLTLPDLRGFLLLGDSTLKPTPIDAVAIFDHLVAWRPRASSTPLQAAFEAQEQSLKANAVADALCGVVVPALASRDRTAARLEALFAFVDDAKSPDALAASIAFVDTVPTYRPQIMARLRRALFASQWEYVQASVIAVVAWARQSPTTVPYTLIDVLLSAFETRRWTGLSTVLHGVNQLVALGALSGAQLDRLDAPLGDFLNETAYSQVRTGTLEAVSVSLVRQGCVRLAHALEDAGKGGEGGKAWLAEAPADPLPEVRYAADRLD